MSVHNWNPIAIPITESFGVRWYGLSYLAAFLVSYFLIARLARTGGTPVKSSDVILDMVTTIAIASMVGGRIGYCLFYAPELIFTFHSEFPFWGVLEIHRGGMASHGGMIGLGVGAYLFARKYKIPTLHILDLSAWGGAIGIFFGRLANFVNGELFGRVCSAQFPLAMKFPKEMDLWLEKSKLTGALEPWQLEKLKGLGPAVEFVSSQTPEKGIVTQQNWELYVSYLGRTPELAKSYLSFVSSGLDRVTAAVEAHQGDFTAKVLTLIEPVLSPRHPSQLYAALAEGLLVFMVLTWVWRKPRQIGLISFLFGALYVLGRFFGEFYRMPDADIGLGLLGLSRGQWLSVAMGLFVVGFGYWVRSKPLNLMGGWRRSLR